MTDGIIVQLVISRLVYAMRHKALCVCVRVWARSKKKYTSDHIIRRYELDFHRRILMMVFVVFSRITTVLPCVFHPNKKGVGFFVGTKDTEMAIIDSKIQV